MDFKLLKTTIDKFAQQALTKSWQPGEYAKFLTDKKLFDFKDVGKFIFEIMDKLGFQGKVNLKIDIDPKLNVKVSVFDAATSTPTKDNISKRLGQMVEQTFGPKMTAAMKGVAPSPLVVMTIPWLENLG